MGLSPGLCYLRDARLLVMLPKPNSVQPDLKKSDITGFRSLLIQVSIPVEGGSLGEYTNLLLSFKGMRYSVLGKPFFHWG